MKRNIIYLFLLATTSILLSQVDPLINKDTSTNNEVIVKGIVIDVDYSEAIIGANILIHNTTIGTSTDFDGRFELSIKKSSLPATLDISYTGYNSQQIIITKAEPSLKIIMNSDNISMCEVVVTGSRRREKVFDSPASMSVITSRKLGKNRKSKRKKKNQRTNQNNLVLSSPENYAPIQENEFHEATKDPLSTFSIDVDAAAYSNVRRFINQGQLPPADAVRIEEMINYFNYQYPTPKGEHPMEIITELSSCPWNPDHQLVHIGLQGQKMDKSTLPPSNLVFLIDVSGSMSSANKLPLLKQAFTLLVKELRPIDTIAMVVYAGAAGLVLPPTSGQEKQKILDALNQLGAGGSTAGAAGIKLAYQIAQEQYLTKGNNRVILATDGDFNVGTSSDGALVKLIEKKRKSGIFLTVLGFGMGNYQDYKMQLLADKGNGNHAYIDNLQEAKKVFINEFNGTLFTIAKDVKLQLEFNPSQVQGYRLIGYENRLLDKKDFNDDTKDAGELGVGHTVTALYEVIPVGIKNSFMASVDPLKYQKEKLKKPNKYSDELLTIKLRYKKPKASKSQLLSTIVNHQITPLAQTSNNFRFSAAVASFGMLLRGSKFKKNATYAATYQMAENSIGTDTYGYRKGFLDLINAIQLLDKVNAVKGE